MAVFSTNQVRQLYVVKAVDNNYSVSTGAWTPTVKKVGTVGATSDKSKTHLYFNYIGAGGQMRSDLIDIKNILHVKVTSGSDASQSRKLKKVKVTLDTKVNGGSPVSGEDYILRIAFRQFVGMSDEDQYFKYGMVHAYAGMTTSDFYKTLALSLAKNFSREETPLVSFALTTSSSEVPVTPTTAASSLNGNYTAVTITEVEQPWRLGIMEQTPVYFTVMPTVINVNSEEVVWGVAADMDSGKSVSNGKAIADLEYFCMGERGDMYRGVGWPHNIPTTYLVDPTLTYDVIDIHYAYVGSNESVQKSEKTITLVMPKNSNITNTLIGAINTATGLTIATI